MKKVSLFFMNELNLLEKLDMIIFSNEEYMRPIYRTRFLTGHLCNCVYDIIKKEFNK